MNACLEVVGPAALGGKEGRKFGPPAPPVASQSLSPFVAAFCSARSGRVDRGVSGLRWQRMNANVTDCTAGCSLATAGRPRSPPVPQATPPPPWKYVDGRRRRLVKPDTNFAYQTAADGPTRRRPKAAAVFFSAMRTPSLLLLQTAAAAAAIALPLRLAWQQGN